jgi:sulfhydrogenase subunit delta
MKKLLDLSTETCPTVDIKRMKKPSQKPKVAFFSLTCCEGCQFAILDLGKRFFDLADKIDIVQMRLIEEQVDKNKYYDVAIIEGAPVERKDFELVKAIREKAKIVITIGACANSGNFMRIKNWRNKTNLMSYVYQHCELINNPDVFPVENVIKVDYKILGCPPNAEDFLQAVYNLLVGKKPNLTKRPVCHECQLNEYECLLQREKGGPEVCLGPLAQGGCNAICLKSKMPCWACRGLMEDKTIENVKNLEKVLKNKFEKKEIEQAMEVFGMKDEFRI